MMENLRSVIDSNPWYFLDSKQVPLCIYIHVILKISPIWQSNFLISLLFQTSVVSTNVISNNKASHYVVFIKIVTTYQLIIYEKHIVGLSTFCNKDRYCTYVEIDSVVR